MWHRCKVNKCWKNSANSLAWYWVATNLQVVKNVLSLKHNKVKCNKTRSACIWSIQHSRFPQSKAERKKKRTCCILYNTSSPASQACREKQNLKIVRDIATRKNYSQLLIWIHIRIVLQHCSKDSSDGHFNLLWWKHMTLVAVFFNSFIEI